MYSFRTKRPILRSMLTQNPLAQYALAPQRYAPSGLGVAATAATQNDSAHPWLPATFFDGPPTPTARRWFKILTSGPLQIPGFPPFLPGPFRSAIFFSQFGTQQQDAWVEIRTIPLPNGGSRLEARFTGGFEVPSGGVPSGG